MTDVFHGRVLVGLDAPASGTVRAWGTPLSFWGGYDARSGTIIDRTHPGFGSVVAGTLLYLPSGRGSSSSSSVLAEAIRLGTAPRAILLGEVEPMIVTAVLVARLLYGMLCPVVVSEGLGAHVAAVAGRNGVLAPDARHPGSAVLRLARSDTRTCPDS